MITEYLSNFQNVMLLQRRISSNRLDRTPSDILRTVACDIFPIRFMNISIATYQQPKPHDLAKDRLIRTVRNNVVNRAYCWDSKDNPANWDSYPSHWDIGESSAGNQLRTTRHMMLISKHSRVDRVALRPVSLRILPDTHVVAAINISLRHQRNQKLK